MNATYNFSYNQRTLPLTTPAPGNGSHVCASRMAWSIVLRRSGAESKDGKGRKIFPSEDCTTFFNSEETEKRFLEREELLRVVRGRRRGMVRLMLRSADAREAAFGARHAPRAALTTPN